MYILKKSTRNEKKFMVKTPSGKTVHFGATGYSDFTMHKDPDRKQRYINRHKRNEDWKNPSTAGFWSRWLLWNETTIQKSIKNIEKKFGLKIKYI